MSIVSSSANCLAPPTVACAKIMSTEGLKYWWIGNLKIQEIDPTWPAIGSSMKWSAGGGIFKATVTKDVRPHLVELLVNTPSVDSTIINIFKELPNGGTSYTKSVEPNFRTTITRFFSPMFLFILSKFVKTEVKRAAKFADLKS